MTDKETILSYIASLAEKDVISLEELNSAFGKGLRDRDNFAPAPRPDPVAKDEDVATRTKREIKAQDVRKKLSETINLAQILYYVGGAVVFLGIAIFVGQNWDSLGVGGRIMSTLGAGIAAYTVGLIFSRDERTEGAAQPFFFISALVMPIGMHVMLDNAGIKASSLGYQTVISAVLLAAYATSFFVFRKTIFILFSILFATWFFFSITGYLVSGGHQFDQGDFYLYRFLAVGGSYVFLGRAFADGQHGSLSGFLNNFGIIAILGAALGLGGYKPGQNIFWEVIYPGLVFGLMFMSVRVKSKAYLVWSSIFLMAFLLKLTAEYFTSGAGWPLALVMAGFFLIGVGYMTIRIKRKYLAD